MGIVSKLFILTFGLCMCILITIFIWQTFFFQYYYASRKITDIKSHIESFQQLYQENAGDVNRIQTIQSDFYRDYGIWIAVLDDVGHIKYSDDFYLEVEKDQIIVIDENNNDIQLELTKIPLYHLMNLEDYSQMGEVWSDLNGTTFHAQGIVEESYFIPIFLSLYSDTLYQYTSFKNHILYETISESDSRYNLVMGNIKNHSLPDLKQTSSWIYQYPIFLEQMQEFQAALLSKDEEVPIVLQSFDYEKNGVDYKVIIQPIKESQGNITYIFTMTSFQPVIDAVEILQSYYIYVVLLALVLIFLSSLYYSRRIAKPLLDVNAVTERIVHLDFTEKLNRSSKDEIGDLSRNINKLSDTLHSYILKLHHDIEKEKELETIRKDFISNVSHELKTPLSVMKGCISILQDGVASHKRDYYFQALEKEVDKMNLLVVDMLELAKLESGTYKMEMHTFTLDKVIEEIVDRLAGEAAKKNLQLDLQISTIKVIANQSYIEQVITNIVSNAIAYTPPRERIIISVTVKGQKAKVSVENKGVHLTDEKIEQVWDRFYSGDVSRNRSFGGTGLGLAISRSILELHGVVYGVKNTDEGVIFFFYLNIQK